MLQQEEGEKIRGEIVPFQYSFHASDINYLKKLYQKGRKYLLESDRKLTWKKDFSK